MTEFMSKFIAGIFLASLLISGIAPARAQEYTPVEIRDLKASPQRYWAKGFVFQDALVEYPQNKLLKIDNRSVTRFKTRDLGYIYVEKDAVDTLRDFTIGKEYLFSGIIGQRERGFFGGGGDYIVIIQQAIVPKSEQSVSVETFSGIRKGNSTNIYNQVFASLDIILKEVEKDLFAYTASTNISLKSLFDPANNQLDKVSTSVRKSLRKMEDQTKKPVDEYFISLLISIMAAQQGYVETTTAPYQPEDTVAVSVSDTNAVPENPEPSIDVKAKKEEWDLSKEAPVLEVPPAVTETNMPEPSVESNATSGAVEVKPEVEPAAEHVEKVVEAVEAPAVMEPAPVAAETAIAAPAVIAPETVEPTAAETLVEQVKAEEPETKAPVVIESVAPENPVEAVVPETKASVVQETPVVEPVQKSSVEKPKSTKPAKKKVKPAAATNDVVKSVTEPVLDTPAPVKETVNATTAPAQEEIDYSKPLRVK